MSDNTQERRSMEKAERKASERAFVAVFSALFFIAIGTVLGSIAGHYEGRNEVLTSQMNRSNPEPKQVSAINQPIRISQAETTQGIAVSGTFTEDNTQKVLDGMAATITRKGR